MYLLFQLQKIESVEKNEYMKNKQTIIYSTFYKENKVVKKFEDVKYGSGIAIKINTTNIKEKNKIQNLIEKEN